VFLLGKLTLCTRNERGLARIPTRWLLTAGQEWNVAAPAARSQPGEPTSAARGTRLASRVRHAANDEPAGGPREDSDGDEHDGGDGGDQLLPPGKIAIVLAHGLGGDAESFDASLVAAIEAEGHAVLRTAVPGVESVAVRAASLGPQLDDFLAKTGASKVHVIAHSMGGLDTRHAIAKLGYAGKVASLTTLSTPHRGSPLADLALGLTSSGTTSQQEALEALADLVGVPLDSEALQRALADLSETNAPAFNAANPDAPGVEYMSFAGLSTPNGISNPNAAMACTGAAVPSPAPTRAMLLLAQPIVANGTDRVPNDAVVAVSSAKWGSFLGCIPADHLAETGAATPMLDTPAFYKALAAKLAAI
jgi:triacylglycerol lipase